MIDEKKVALMTKLAIFEKHESGESLVLSKYYKSDYVRYNMLKSLIAATIVYWAIIAAYVFMKFDQMLADINKLNYFDLIYKVLAGFVVALVFFFLFSSLFSLSLSSNARPGLTKYNSNLKKLIELEGGTGKVGKVVNDVLDEDKASIYEKTVERTPEQKAEMARRTVSRTALVRQSQEREDKVKQQQIIDNINQRNARIAAQNDAKLRQQQQREYDRQMIMERRRQLEQAQQELRRTQSFQQTQSTATNKMEGRDK